MIRKTISRHCDDRRVESVIVNVLREVLANQYFKKADGDKSFKKRYKELILANFKEELENG